MVGSFGKPFMYMRNFGKVKTFFVYLCIYLLIPGLLYLIVGSLVNRVALGNIDYSLRVLRFSLIIGLPLLLIRYYFDLREKS